MVRHEAADNYCEPFVTRSAQKLIHHQVNDRFVVEALRAFMCAEGQEVSIDTGVGEGRQVVRVVCVHADAKAMRAPRSPLKPDATKSG